MKKRIKELEIGKGAMYAVPFRGATVAMEAVLRRGVYREGEERSAGDGRDDIKYPVWGVKKGKMTERKGMKSVKRSIGMGMQTYAIFLIFGTQIKTEKLLGSIILI